MNIPAHTRAPQPDSMPLIQVEGLTKTFRVSKRRAGLKGALTTFIRGGHTLVHAVEDVTFAIGQGELVGYLGPNGAGKSTTIKMLTGLLVPSRGEMHVNGFVPWRERVRYVAGIGAVFGQRTTLWWDLPVIDSFELLAQIYQVPPARFRQNLNEFRTLLALDEFLHTPVRALSLGQRMRADFCAAMLHNPPLLFLDEPTVGLDVVAKERIRQFIAHINAEHGTTVLLTTHDLHDVERLCRRVLIIDHGRLLYDGSLEQLQARFGGERELVVDFAEPYPAVDVEGAQVVEYGEMRALYTFARDSISASELIGRISAVYRVRDLSVREPQIEATIRRIYEERLLDTPSPVNPLKPAESTD